MSTFTFKALMLCAIVVTLTACTPVPASSPSIDATNPPVFASTMFPVPAATPRPTPTIVPVSTPTPRPTPLPPVTPSPAFTLMPPTMSLSHVDRVYPGFNGSSGWPMPTQKPEVVAWMHGDAIPPNPSFTISYTSGDTFIVEVTADDPPESLSVQAEIDHSGGRIEPPFPPLVIEPFEIEPGSTSQFTLDLPNGTYMVRVEGSWSNGGRHFLFVEDQGQIASILQQLHPAT